MTLTAFVTGATGFVGSNLVRELHQQGWAVNILARKSSVLDDIEGIPVKRYTGDIVDSASILQAMPEDVDAVFHVAASTNVWSGNNDEQDRINIGGTRNVIEAAVHQRAKRFIHTSSFTTWGFQDTILTEHSQRTDATDWINYIRTKHIAEKLVKESVRDGRLDAVILCPGHILGPGDRHNWSTMVRMVQTGKLPGVPPGSGAFCDVREVAKAHIAAFHHAEKGETYLLGGEQVSFLEVIQIVGELLNKPVPAKATPAWLMKAAARVKVMIAAITGKEPNVTPESVVMVTHHIQCDSSRAQRQLGYQFTPIRPLLKETIDWMWKVGML